MAQNFGYRILSTEDGLPQNSISALTLDAQGYLWIGTQDGLSRFDGSQFLNYQYGAAVRSLHNVAIYDLQTSPSGDLYILGNYAVEKFDQKRDSSLRLATLPAGHRYRNLLLEPTSGQVLLKTFDGAGFTPLSEALQTESQIDVFWDAYYDPDKNLLWKFDRKKHNVFLSDLKGKEIRRYDNTGPQRIERVLYIHSPQKIICTLTDAAQQASHLALVEISDTGIQIIRQHPIAKVVKVVYQASRQRYCAIDRTGNLFLLDKDWKLIKKINAYKQAAARVPSLLMTKAMIHQDHLWLGVDPLGILYRSLGDNQFSIVDFPQQPPAIIKNVFTDKQNRLYAYVLEKGLQVFSSDGQLISDQIPLPAALRSPNIFAGFNGLRQIGDQQFVLSGREVFGKLDLDTYEWTDYYDRLKQQVPANEFNDAYLFYEPLDEDRAWVSVRQCIYEYTLSTGRFQKRECLNAPITCFLSEEGRVWIGTESGLHRWENDQMTADARFDKLFVKDLRRDRQGRLIIASSIGLYLLHKDSLQVIDQSNGLKNNYIYGSLTDDKGALWLSTNQGLSKIDLQTQSIRHYDREDGISATEYNSYGFWKAQNGRLYFSGIGGITIIDPSAESKLQDSIPLVISALSLNDRLPERLHTTDTVLQLAPDQNTLTFHFADLLLAGKSDLLFRYKLEGFDEHWVQTDQSAARYPQLPAGRYNFRLQLAQQAAKEQRLAFVIALPIYKRPWFIALAGLLLLSTIVALVHLSRRRRLIQLEEERQRKMALEEERRRISRELHDNMGAHTTALISNIQSMQDTAALPAQQRQLEYMQSVARNILSSLRDTIWVLNGKQMHLTELVDLVKMFALRLIGNRGDYHLLVNEQIEADVLLEASQIVHLKAMLQEIIHNSLKHAGGDCITFNIQSEQQSVRLHISDNGRGFDPEHVAKGNGLENIEWRAQEINCVLERKTGAEGTFYEIVLGGG
ncbi:MAG: two-component regulator propeller domain-containing protein [Bacteroidota bacterium]